MTCMRASRITNVRIFPQYHHSSSLSFCPTFVKSEYCVPTSEKSIYVIDNLLPSERERKGLVGVILEKCLKHNNLHDPFIPPRNQTPLLEGSKAGNTREELQSTSLSLKEIRLRRLQRNRLLWKYIHTKNWSLWFSTISLYRSSGMNFDETTYTFVIFGYLLSHRHMTSTGLQLLEEMGNMSGIHPVVHYTVQTFFHNYMKIGDTCIFLRPDKDVWQNVVRFTSNVSDRIIKRRMSRLKNVIEENIDSYPHGTNFDPTEIANRLVGEEHTRARLLISTLKKKSDYENRSMNLSYDKWNLLFSHESKKIGDEYMTPDNLQWDEGYHMIT